MVLCRFDTESRDARGTATPIEKSRTDCDDRRRLCSAEPNRVRSTRDPDFDRAPGARRSGKTGSRSRRRANARVPIRRSVHRDYVVCLECGWRGQMLRRHIAGHGLSVEQYRARWSLRPDHPITAPDYSERRSTIAKQLGLGRTREASVETKAVSEMETQ